MTLGKRLSASAQFVAGLALGLSIFAATSRADMDAGNCADSQKALVSTSHAVTINGQAIAYTATAGFIQVTAADQSSKACVFYTAYTVAPAAGAPQRPLTFAFNGGPGSASLWLHLGLLGPKRVDMGPDGLSAPSTTALITNDFSPLDVTDIVMIDPVATGFSRAADPNANDQFFGVRNDYTSIESFIQTYLDVNNRWQAPKYLLGESYGGIRGSLLAHHLQSDFNIAIKGVVFISPALSDTTADFSGDDNNVAWWTFFPNYATTAWFHKKIAAKYQNMTVDQVYNLAQQFANTKLRDALDQGDLLDPAVFDSTAQDVADFVGLPKARIAQLNLRVSPENMFLEELSSAGLGIGRYDSRFTAPFVPGTNFDDPSGTATGYPFTADINEYLRTELNFPQAQSPYNVFGQITSWPDEGGQTDVMTDISLALATNPNMKIMIASGYFDLACPMGTVAYELAQMPDGAKLGSRIVQKRYFGGHMMYINPAALQQLKTDIAQFMTTP